MPPNSSLLVASAVLGAGAHVGLVAVAFLLSPWRQASPDPGAIGSMLFAPFALLALVLPLAAVPLTRKLSHDTVSDTVHGLAAFLILALGAEAFFMALSLAGGGRPDDTPLLAHVMLVAYAATASILIKRRLPHGKSIPEPD